MSKLSLKTLFIVLMLSVVHGASYGCNRPYIPGNYVGSLRAPTKCIIKSPSDCPRSWKAGIPEGLAKSKPLIYSEFIICHEGFSTCGYVPINPKNGEVLGNSGVTIGAGIDLGSKSAIYPGFSAVSSSLVGKLEPYFGLKKNHAACAAIEKPLDLSTNEAKVVTSAVKEIFAKIVEERYNKDKEGKALEFSSLPRGIRTAIVSVLFQFGNPESSPTFWKFVKKNDWKKAIKELRNFYTNPGSQMTGDLKRRNNEADIIEATLLECNRSIDVVFLIDESGSVTLADFRESLDFVVKLTRAFPDEKLRGEDGTRFGLSTFNGYYTPVTFTYLNINLSINNIVQKRGSTYLGLALENILVDQFSEERVRSESDGVPRVLIVLTDGQSHDAVTTPAQRVREENIVIYTPSASGTTIMTNSSKSPHLLHTFTPSSSSWNWRLSLRHSRQRLAMSLNPSL